VKEETMMQTAADAAPPPPPEENRPPPRGGPREQAIELGVFLFLIAPSLALSFVAGREAGVGFTVIAIATILRDLSLVGLILFFLWRNGEPPTRIGLTAGRGAREALIGVWLFPALWAGLALLDTLLRVLGVRPPSIPLPELAATGSAAHLILAILMVAVVAFAEEAIFRGYLMLRLQAVTGSPGAAVLLSAVIFAFGHGYEGTAGLIAVGFMGIVFGVVYQRRGSLIAPMVMHFLNDLMVLVVLPLTRLGR
jgi:CAAX protease family protein